MSIFKVINVEVVDCLNEIVEFFEFVFGLVDEIFEILFDLF